MVQQEVVVAGERVEIDAFQFVEPVLVEQRIGERRSIEHADVVTIVHEVAVVTAIPGTRWLVRDVLLGVPVIEFAFVLRHDLLKSFVFERERREGQMKFIFKIYPHNLKLKLNGFIARNQKYLTVFDSLEVSDGGEVSAKHGSQQQHSMALDHQLERARAQRGG